MSMARLPSEPETIDAASQPNGLQGESVEGLDVPEQIDWGTYPVDRILVRQESATIVDTMRRIDKKFYIMDPEFQRGFLWTPEQQSRLIESVVMRIPLPVFYLAEQMDGTRVVVDGLQRLTSLHRYVNNEFALRLKNQELSKRFFKDLPPKYQNRIEDTNLMLILLDAKMPERVRLDIFERVNSGTPINRQQMRNCLYQGKATRFLRTQAESPAFQEATGNSLNVRTMRDREVINRFCAFYLLGIEPYRGDLDDYLAQALRKMNNAPDDEINQLAEAFQRSMRMNQSLFGEYAFRKPSSIDPGRRSTFNAALFDVFSVLLAHIDEAFFSGREAAMKERFQRLMADEAFIAAITLGTNGTRQVNERFSKVAAMLEEVLHAPSVDPALV